MIARRVALLLHPGRLHPGLSHPFLSGNPVPRRGVSSILVVLWTTLLVSGCGIFGSDPASRPPAPPGVRQPPPVELPQGYDCAVHDKACSQDEVIAYWHRGRLYYFCAEECLTEFLAHPPDDDR